MQIIPVTAFSLPTGTLPKDGLYERGKIKFLSGANAGAEMEIVNNSGAELTLYLPLFYTPSAGDQIQLTTGCNRKINVCRDEYDNGINNRSFYMLPGRNRALRLPD
jgi:uncharacterized phage protein (TIGR02218 family)